METQQKEMEKQLQTLIEEKIAATLNERMKQIKTMVSNMMDKMMATFLNNIGFMIVLPALSDGSAVENNC